MSEEIKEILDKLQKVANRETASRNALMEMKDKDYQFLLDYITNLQQENKEYSMIFDTFSKRPYAHKYLEEKKKELNNDRIIGLDSEMVYKDYYDYKSRCEKAIELYKNCKEEDYCILSLNMYEALNGSNEKKRQ